MESKYNKYKIEKTLCIITDNVINKHESWCSHERVAKTDTEEKNLLNKVIFLFFIFAHKKYSHIITVTNNWCHMDYFNDVLTTFLGLERVSCVAVYTGSESSQISSKMS